MEKFKQYWPIYLLYVAELAVYLLFCVGYITMRFFIKSVDVAAVSEGLGALLLQLILAAPVVFGFFSRRYFIRGLWVAYVWISAYLSMNSDWVSLAVVIGHAVVVTYVLLFTASGRGYFAGPSVPEVSGGQAEADFRFERSADAVLRMRQADARPSANASSRERLMQGYWIGAAMMAWGLLLAQAPIASLGFVTVLVCFVLHRRAGGRPYGIFFRRVSSGDKRF
jgi:hypothetical protein